MHIRRLLNVDENRLRKAMKVVYGDGVLTHDLPGDLVVADRVLRITMWAYARRERRGRREYQFGTGGPERLDDLVKVGRVVFEFRLAPISWIVGVSTIGFDALEVVQPKVEMDDVKVGVRRQFVKLLIMTSLRKGDIFM